MMKYLLKGLGVLLLSLGITGFIIYNELGLDQYGQDVINFLYNNFHNQLDNYGFIYTILSFVVVKRIGLTIFGIISCAISIFVSKPDVMKNVLLRTRIYTVKKGLVVFNHSALFFIFFIIEILIAAIIRPWYVIILIALFFVFGYRLHIDKSGNVESGIYDKKLIYLYNCAKNLIVRKDVEN